MPIFQLLKDKYTPETLPYHAIVPSLPGYTFSSGPRRDEDFGAEDAARIFDRLMSAIGLGDAYVVQGGDIGSTVARYSAMNYHGCKGRLSELIYWACSYEMLTYSGPRDSPSSYAIPLIVNGTSIIAKSQLALMLPLIIS